MSLSSNGSGGLRRVRDSIPVRLWTVASISFWGKAAFWGLTAPWQNYMQHPPRLTHEDTPGALGLGQVKATRIYCAFYIAYYVSPMFFAILSDSRLGRYRTLFVCLMLFNLGCAAITLSSLPSSLAAGWGLPGLNVAMVCVALGGGGFESNMAAFLADQYAETEPRIKTLASGEEVLTDRVLTIEYIYSLNYWLGNVGSLSWFAVVALEEHVGFAVAYGLCFGFVSISLLTLLAGRGYFVRVPHEAKVFTQASRILLCTARNGFRLARAEPKYQLEHRRKIVPWCAQLNNLISQSAQMETSGTPNDMLPAMNQVGCILFTPFIHHFIYPLLHKRHIYLQPITRITIGFGFVVSSMSYAAVVQKVIYASGPCYDHPRACSSAADGEPNHINVWIQAPVFFLIAMGEAWAYVTALEIAYSHAPKNMKSMVQAIFPLMAGVGSASAMGLTTFAHDPNLVIFYASLAGGMAITTVVFWLMFRKYDRGPADNKSDASVDISDAPSTRRSQRTSVIAGLVPEPGRADMKLGVMHPPYAKNGLVSPRLCNRTGTTIVNQNHGLAYSADEPALSQQTPVPVSEATRPVQVLLPPPRSPSKKHEGSRNNSPGSQWSSSVKALPLPHLIPFHRPDGHLFTWVPMMGD
ncbi:oligopeptide transporter [Paraphaeosphaeria minitans]|uniref:Oligopeptide transporter n=1 Tax=Paraphaeosphaeria minitans TaxID=565426 RepID=A0A9P6G8R3_9PLEO|nr:oligopeptide transporter [Paraphaeosphaeria minitans]